MFEVTTHIFPTFNLEDYNRKKSAKNTQVFVFTLQFQKY